MAKVGRLAAKGMVLELYVAAQKFWLASGGCGIPKPAWKRERLSDELIEFGLAEDNGDFLYAVGSKEAFAWLVACSENGKEGGPAAAKARIENKGKSKRQKSSKHVENRQDTSSYSSSPSYSSSSSESNSFSEDKSTGGAAPRPARPSVATWDEYRGAYEKRYGAPPVRNATVNALLVAFVKRIGEEEAPFVAAFYVQHNSAFYVQAMHPVNLLVRDAEKLRTEWATGRQMNRERAKQAETRSTNVDAMREFIARKEGIA